MTTLRLSAADKEALDRPVWSALTSKHRPLALGRDLARRYPTMIAPFAAMSSGTPDAVAELRGLVTDGPVALLSFAALDPMDGLQARAGGMVRQMIWRGNSATWPDTSPDDLGADDVPAMLALTALTKPGPFAAETYRLGRYIGIRDGDRLAAMAGERMRLDGFTEISAVCVHPDYRGKGFAQLLMKNLIKTICTAGDVPILHVFETNRGAIALYERLGFATRTGFRITVLSHADLGAR